MTLRKLFFWTHLLAGCVAGIVILVMSVTGVLLALQPQILEFADRNQRLVVAPRDGAPRLSAGALLAEVRKSRPELRPTAITLTDDKNVAASIALGREGTLYVDPYSGKVTGMASQRARQVFRSVTDWHRWLAAKEESRPAARAVTGACNAAFLLLALTGPFIWWPKKWTPQIVRRAIWFQPAESSRARDWNWHNTIGIWCAPILVILTATGMVISYQWAGNLLYTITGNTPPAPLAVPQRPAGDAQRERGAKEPLPGAPAFVFSAETADRLWERASQHAPGWKSLSMRIPVRPGPVAFTIVEASAWGNFQRSQLALDVTAAEIVRWEPYSALNAGRKLRTWARFAHTGEAGLLPGQMVAGIASLGGGFLVWTGLALGVRRFVAWTRRKLHAAATPQQVVTEIVPMEPAAPSEAGLG